MKLFQDIRNINKRETANLTLFCAGKLISVFGTAICNFAIGLYVLERTGSGLSFSIAIVLGFVPIVLFSPVGGVLADRYSKKAVVVIADTVNGLLFLALYLITSAREIDLALIYIGAFLTASLTAVFNTGMESAKPHIVSDKRLISINAVSRIIDSTSTILAPVAGGLVFALIGVRAFLLFNAISFVVSAAMEMLIDFKFNTTQEKKEAQSGGFIQDIRSGVRFIKKRRDIVRAIWILVAVNVFLSFSVTVPVPYIINVVLGLGAEQFGIIEGAFPAGIIVGALFVRRVVKKISTERLLRMACYALAAAMLLLALPLALRHVISSQTFYFIYHVAIMGAFGVIISFIDIPIVYQLQRTVDEAYRGRVLSLSISVVKLLAPAALLLSGFLLGDVSALPIVASGGAGLLVFTVLFAKQRLSQQKTARQAQPPQ